MGSLNSDGTKILQTTNRLTIRHRGDFLTEANSVTDTRSSDISNSGVIRTNFDSRGVAWQQNDGTSATSGLPGERHSADNTVERQKFTANGEEAGNLQHHATRKIDGVFVSVSDRQAIVDPVAAIGSGLAGGDALGAMQTITERKAFWIESDRNKTSGLAAWTIFDSNGDAVGETDGTTDIDITPNEGLIGFPE